MVYYKKSKAFNLKVADSISLLLILLSFSYQIFASYEASTVSFHPSGRILQTEYACDAAHKGGPIIAYKHKTNIILLSARNFKKSIFNKSLTKKIYFIDSHISIAVTGLLFDGEAVISIAKKISMEYKSIYNDMIPIEYLCDELSHVIHQQTRYGDRRPIGVSLLVSGWDNKYGSQIYTIEPDGSYYGWNAIAV
eukprot:gene13830-18550_t